MTEEHWLAAYLYYAEPFEPLLKEFVQPITTEIKKVTGISQFFFIRYWHQGPHIRLRFKGDEELLNGKVKAKIKNQFKEFVQRTPSKREDPEWLSKLDKKNQWRPNNSIEFVKYEQEVERYGGEEAIKIAEQHFQHSSEIILELLSESDAWDYEQALGEAIKLHLSFAHAVGMDTDEAKHFFNYIFVSWFPRAVARNWSNLDEPKQDEMKKETLKAFEKGFENQKEILAPFCQKFWDTLLDDSSISKKVDNWIDKTKKTAGNLINLQESENLFTPSQFNYSEKWRVSKENYERWRIYQSYVHMNNNRLGILNRDEGFLGFLIKESFKHTNKKTESIQ